MVPNEAPTHEKPEFNGGVVPNETIIDTAHNTATSKTSQLPNTGTQNSALGIIGMLIGLLAFGFIKRKD